MYCVPKAKPASNRGSEGEDWYERQSTVTLRDHGCGTQPQRTGVKDAGYGRPVRAELCQGVGPQLWWLCRRRRSRVALNRSGNPTSGPPVQSKDLRDP
jgi:hypothetical protein